MFKYSNSKNVLVEYDLADANLDDDQLKDRLAGMKIKLELAFDDKQTTTTTKKTVKNEPNIENKAVKSSLSHVAKANQSLSSKIKEEKAFVFEKWNIRKCDVIGVDAITTNDDQVLPVTTRLKLSGRYFQFGGLHSNAFSIEFSSKGTVRFILREEHYDIKIAIGILDIAYIACMFDYPFYAISFCVNDSAVDVYLNDLKNLDRYDHNLKLDNKSRSQIIALIDIEQEEEESDLIDKLHSYFAYHFSSQNKDFNKLVGFLSPAKSKEIIANAFIERKSRPKEVTSFLNDYPMAQTVSVESGLSARNYFEKSASRNFSGTFLSERIYIGNISRLVNEAELKDLFQSFGKIYDICIIRKPRGPDNEFTFGFITYYESESANEAIKSMDGFYICGRALKVELAKPN